LIPLKDDIPSESFPIVTLTIIGLNCAVFFYQLLLGANNERLISTLGIIPYELSHLRDIPPLAPIPLPFTVLTSMFLHGGLAHVGGNMLYLWIFGDNVEDSMGHMRFAVFYLLCGVAAAITQIMIAPNSTIPMIGASGAISGVLGAYLLLFPQAKVITLIFFGFLIETVRLPAAFFLTFWIVVQFLSGAFSLTAHSISGGVAWFAHIGGFIAGVVLVSWFKRRRRRFGISRHIDRGDVGRWW